MKPWLSGPTELLEHALEHLRAGSPFDCRIALISIDNAVELSVKTYLGLPRRARGSDGPSRRELEKHYRTDQKIRYSEIHLKELTENPNWGSNDEWENAHQESFFFHLAGAVDGLLHEVDDRYKLQLSRVGLWKVRDKLQSLKLKSPAVDRLLALRADDESWLSLLYRWRNYGIHKKHVGRVVTMSTHSRTDNYFTDPKTKDKQTVYRDAGGREVCQRLCSDMRELVDRCRTDDPLL